MTWTAVSPSPAGFLNNANPATAAITTHATGNLIVCINTMHEDAGVFPNSMSSSRVTWVKIPGTDVQDATQLAGPGPTWSGNLWFGTVNSAGTDTVTFGYTSTVPAHTNCVMQEFTSSVGSWHMDTWTTLNSTGTSNWPSLTAAGSGEIYLGFAWNSGGASGGPSAPWVVVDNSDSSSNAMAYNTAYVSGTVPTFTDTGSVYGMFLLVAEGPAAAATPAALAVPLPPGWFPGADAVATLPGGTPFWVPPVPGPGIAAGTFGPVCATAQGIIAGGTGTWVNPGNAAGPPDGSFAAWVAP